MADAYDYLEDPGIRTFLREGERLYPPGAVNFTFAEQRAFYDRYAAHFRKPRPAGVVSEDVAIAGIPCRCFRTNASPKPPAVVYLHGGGFILGGLDSHDGVCADICDCADVEVVAVDYRLAPEHPFPAAFDDGWSVLRHLAAHDSRPIALVGDRAGGNLAAVLALKARDAGGPAIAGQILIYPGLGGNRTTGSYVSQTNAPGLTTANIDYYRRIYASSKYAEPLSETDYSIAAAFANAGYPARVVQPQ